MNASCGNLRSLVPWSPLFLFFTLRSVFIALLLPCIILNANQRTRTGNEASSNYHVTVVGWLAGCFLLHTKSSRESATMLTDQALT